jgi:succinoglycan biosynthesis protein ExoM
MDDDLSALTMNGTAQKQEASIALGPQKPLIDEVTIAICTFKRQSIRDTLESIARQRIDGVRIAVIVVDNDDHPSAMALVEETSRALGLIVEYHHVPGRNISIARNACLAACRSRWIAFIDDDEIAGDGWLHALLGKATVAPGAAAIFGPVSAVYDSNCPKWMIDGDFHSFSVVWVKGIIETGYTSNVLIDLAHPAMANMRFDLDFGRSGGEDSDFFYRGFRAGAGYHFASGARVSEWVTPSRRSFSWLLRRRFRSGQSHARIKTAGYSSTGRLNSGALAAAKAAWCIIFAISAIGHPVRWRSAVLRGILHAGFVTRILGVNEGQLYGIDNADRLPRYSVSS